MWTTAWIAAAETLIIAFGQSSLNIGFELGSHKALWPVAVAHENALARPQFRETIPAKCFHMHKYVRSILATCQEAITTDLIEPLNDGGFKVTFRHHMNVRALGQLRRMNRGAFIHFKDTKGLQALRLPEDLAHHPCTFIGCLMAISAQHCDMKQDVRHSIVWNDEAIPFGCVKPLNGARNFDNIRRSIFYSFIESCDIIYEWRAVAPHAANPAVNSTAS